MYKIDCLTAMCSAKIYLLGGLGSTTSSLYMVRITVLLPLFNIIVLL